MGDLARELAEEDDDSGAPPRQRFLVNNATVEKLGEILNQNPNGVLLYCDELIGWLRSLDRDGHEGDRAFYLTAWDGDKPYTYDRIGRGTLDIRAAIISIVGGIQPGVLQDYLRQAVGGGAGDDGLMQRFQLAVWPDVPGDWQNVDEYPDVQARADAYGTFEWLAALAPEAIGAERDELDDDAPPYLRFDRDGQSLFDGWRQDMEHRLRAGAEHPALESHLAKYRKLVPALTGESRKVNDMATIGHDANGRRRILFVAGDGKRRTIRLGKVSAKQAEAFKVKVEALAGALITGSMDDETARWVASREDKTHKQLVAAGLLKPRARAGVTLETFAKDHFDALVVKASTAVTYGQTRRSLLEYFGGRKPLRDIEPADAEKWRQWLKANALSNSTIARRVKCARQVFKRAVRWKLLTENPFADVVAGSQSNPARQYFVTRAEAQKVLDACPDAQWRLLFALSRFGGLRCPSEHLALRWSDVDWERNRVRVPSRKTEHLEGGDCRFIPLFPELRAYLLEVFEAAEPGTDFVISRYRDTNANLRTQLCRILKRAGVKAWPKLFHNLRSTRQTELAERHPIHVVCAWLGNSRAVAQEHYLQVTDAHYAAAANADPSGDTSASAAQSPAQYRRETPETIGIGTR